MSEFQSNNKIVKTLKRGERFNLLNSGGRWLGCAREWIQRKFINGDSVTWGSHEVLRTGNYWTVSDIESFAADIAKATLDEFKLHLVTDRERRALAAYTNPNNWKDGRFIGEENLDVEMAAYHRQPYDLVSCCKDTAKEFDLNNPSTIEI